MDASSRAAMDEARSVLAGQTQGAPSNRRGDTLLALADDARRSGTVDRFLDQLDGMSATTAGDGRGGASAYVPQGDR